MHSSVCPELNNLICTALDYSYFQCPYTFLLTYLCIRILAIALPESMPFYGMQIKTCNTFLSAIFVSAKKDFEAATGPGSFCNRSQRENS